MTDVSLYDLTDDDGNSDESLEGTTSNMESKPSLATYITIAVLYTSGIMAWAAAVADIDNMKTQLQKAEEDRIHKEVIIEMFRSRDLQMETMTNQITDLGADVDRTNDMIGQLLQRIPQA